MPLQRGKPGHISGTTCSVTWPPMRSSFYLSHNLYLAAAPGDLLVPPGDIRARDELELAAAGF